jgi:hypothetical protein
MPTETMRPAFPPKARLTFRVGIVGHRPNRLRPEDVPSLAARLGEVLSTIKKLVDDFAAAHPDLFTAAPPSLRAISPLAEGTDRHFARQALKLGYELYCPFPFHKEEFENDFKPPHSLEPEMNSVADFNAILTQAEKTNGLVTFELDGSRADSSQAYATAGRVVLNQSDLLIAVWDGGGGNEHGGTLETLKDALANGVPTLWVDARAPHSCQLLLTVSDLPVCFEQRCVPTGSKVPDLSPVITSLLEPPRAQPESDKKNHPHAPDLREAYFAEHKPAINFWFLWKVFRNLVVSFRPGIPKFRVPEFDQDAAPDCPPGAPGVTGWANSKLTPHHAWADGLADFYADKYRSAFVLCYLLGAFAVILALFPHSFGGTDLSPEALANSATERNCSGIEFLAVLAILSLVWRGNQRHWHDRWMAYRLLAELIRQLRFVVPLGGGHPFPRPAPSAGKRGNPVNSWMYWHLRSIDREAGLPKAKVTAEYLRECLQCVDIVLDDQIRFHNTAAKNNGDIEHRLHRLGVRLFQITFLLIAIHFATHLFEPLKSWHPVLEKYGVTFFCAALPAIGAAVAGINHQGEFARTARRSSAMVEQLTEIRNQLAPLLATNSTVGSTEAAAHALRAAQIMVDEVLDWRVVFLDRPLIVSA